MKVSTHRRQFLYLSAAVGTSLMLDGCGTENKPLVDNPLKQENDPKKDSQPKEGEVTATEDLMREHGIIRRALLVYTAIATRLRTNASTVGTDSLQKTAKLFRAFGEDYHENKLEEGYIFPAVKRAGGLTATYPDILVAQHQRGREITDYILAITQSGKLVNNAEAVAKVLDSFVLMYRNHAAREDTIIFPAWKQTMNAKQLDEIGDKFEDIEHQQFGKDGFEAAVGQISEIETSLGLADLAQFTAPPPPKL